MATAANRRATSERRKWSRPCRPAGWILRRIALACALLLPACGAEAGDRYVFLYGGTLSKDRLLEILERREAKRESSHLVMAGMGWHLATWGESLDWEGEVQIGRHFGEQTHAEGVAVLVARWTRFPWDRWLDTSIAFGEGLSFATTRPPLEETGGTRRLLNYLLAEVAVTVPAARNWDLFVRVHHRSGVFGLFDGAEGGSNVVGGGLRVRF